jgi:hypothetical protein
LVDDSNSKESKTVFSQNLFRENKTVFYINLPKANTRFKLNLFAKINEDSNTLSFVCDFYAELIKERVAAKNSTDFEIKEYMTLSQNHEFYVEEPIEKYLDQNREYTFRVYFKNVPSEVTMHVSNKEVKNKVFYFVQDEEDVSLWTVDMSFNKPGEAQIVAYGFVLGEYKVVKLVFNLMQK